ncbi:MAG: SCP2 sterol-binding domain-containing protein [Oscillospiraceae bacterium]|nr:SCP2 sterol-binding domain-containing protein [Oscillospiraceae bacterium]
MANNTVKNDKTTAPKAEVAKEAAVKEVKSADTVAKTEEVKSAPAEKKTPGRKPASKSATKAPKAAKTEKTAAAKTEKTAAAKTEKASAARKPRAAKAVSYDDVVAKAQKKLAAAKTAKIKYPIAVNFELSGDCDGVFYAYLGEAGVAVEPYKYDDYDVYVRADAKVLVSVFEGKANLIDVLADGSVHIDGNIKKAILFIDAAF